MKKLLVALFAVVLASPLRAQQTGAWNFHETTAWDTQSHVSSESVGAAYGVPASFLPSYLGVGTGVDASRTSQGGWVGLGVSPVTVGRLAPYVGSEWNLNIANSFTGIRTGYAVYLGTIINTATSLKVAKHGPTFSGFQVELRAGQVRQVGHTAELRIGINQ